MNHMNELRCNNYALDKRSRIKLWVQRSEIEAYEDRGEKYSYSVRTSKFEIQNAE